jgi:hypothetical protein
MHHTPEKFAFDVVKVMFLGCQSFVPIFEKSP